MSPMVGMIEIEEDFRGAENASFRVGDDATLARALALLVGHATVRLDNESTSAAVRQEPVALPVRSRRLESGDSSVLEQSWLAADLDRLASDLDAEATAVRRLCRETCAD